MPLSQRGRGREALISVSGSWVVVVTGKNPTEDTLSSTGGNLNFPSSRLVTEMENLNRKKEKTQGTKSLGPPRRSFLQEVQSSDVLKTVENTFNVNATVSRY